MKDKGLMVEGGLIGWKGEDYMRLGCGAHTVHLVSMDILFDHAAHSGDFLQIYISI